MKHQFTFSTIGVVASVPEPRYAKIDGNAPLNMLQFNITCEEWGKDKTPCTYTCEAWRDAKEQVAGFRPGMVVRLEGRIINKPYNGYDRIKFFVNSARIAAGQPMEEQDNVRARERQVYGNRQQAQEAAQSPQNAPQGYQRSGNSYSYGNRQQGGYRQQQEADEDIPF